MDPRISAAIGALAGSAVTAATAVVVSKILKKDEREEQLAAVIDAEQNAYQHGWHDCYNAISNEQLSQNDTIPASY